MAKKVKKDFDKDQMYRKIMPSIEPDIQEQPLPLQPPALEYEEEESSPEQPPQAATEGPASAPAAETPPAPTEPQLHNYMEDMMREKLDRTINILGACDCPRCKMDVLALALNALPSAYAVVQDSSHFMKKLKGVYEVKVTASLIKAIQQVKSMPRHQSQ